MPATKTMKKIVVISLGDVRDEDWEDAAERGLALMKKMREEGFCPETLAPYVMDGGDVPLLILVDVEGSRHMINKKVKFLEALMGEDAWRVKVLKDESEYWWDKN